MSSQPVPTSSPRPSGAAGAALPTAAPQKDGVSELMAAIQSVLEEHNVSDARFVLEIPSTSTAVSTAANTGNAAAPERQGVGNASSMTAPIDSSAPSTGGGTITTTLLMGMRATPAAIPTPPPEHQRPPPRVRTPSAQNRPPITPHTRLLQEHALLEPCTSNSASPLNDTISSLTETARPAPEEVAGDARGTQKTPAEVVQDVPATSITAQLPTQPHPPPPRHPSNTIASDDPTGALTDGVASGVRRVSEQLAHDLAAAEVQMSRKEILQKFVGRSAILEDRRQREAQQQSQASKLLWDGILGPTVPVKAGGASTTTKTSSQPHRGIPTAANKPSARRISADSTTPNGSVNHSSAATLSPPPPESQQPQRRGVVRLTSPPSTSISNGGSGARCSPFSDSSSLPSLVSAKKSAVPGKTPVFSILNKDGSRLLDQGGTAVTLRTSVPGALTAAGGASAPATGAATHGGDVTEVSRISSNSNSNSNNTSISHIRHSRPNSVSLLADDRAPPVPVHEPLLGVAAEEEANRKRGILVQSQLRSPTSEVQPVQSFSQRNDGEALRKMLAEQSKENARRAVQLQSQSRLSLTTDMVTTPMMGKSQPSTHSVLSSGSPPRSPSRPSTSTAAASAQSSLRAMLQEQQQLQDASRRSLEEHNRLMQAARAVRAPAPALSNELKASKTPAVALETSPAHVTTAATGAAAAVSTTAREDEAAHQKAGVNSLARTSPPGHSTNATFTPSASGIQVVKFTLPQEEEARQAAVQQLCRSSSGTQHVDTKDRYRALLAEQQSEFSAQEAKAQDYKALLSRAVEFNRLYQQQRSNLS
ncbi:hypothetical protein, conserved [Leishmania tarentolae]|uniref:Uncharacterized protein n=1 Tax=Leishmania tarentolae TaxID=5689 RepID=A0A640KEF4_LEITA|nr:hypothetical protein, conserved [Leishmania tarentolae]